MNEQPSSLRVLLQRTVPLTKSTLTLRQLVQVYTAFLSQTDIPTSINDSLFHDVAQMHQSRSLTPEFSLTDYFQNDVDRELAASILKSSNNTGVSTDGEKLLLVQYILAMFDRQVSVEQKLCLIVLPVIFDCKDGKSVSEELLEALLDVLLENDNGRMEQDTKSVIFLESSIRRVVSSNASHWVFACRILQRLFHWRFSSPQKKEMIAAALTGQVVWLLSKDDDDNKDDSVASAWYRPIANDILPCLVEIANEESFSQIWKAIWASNNIMTQTTILCALIPSVLNQELPVDDCNESRGRPFLQENVWILIHNCLGQGILRNKNEIPFVYPKMRQLVRRRALYILRAMVEHEQEAQLWNKYVACFEVLEMESEAHLIDQIWDTMTELFEHADTIESMQSTTIISPPNLSWHWMELILGRAVAPPQEMARDDTSTILRKLGIYRFLKGQTGIRMIESCARDSENVKLRGAPLQMITVDFLFSMVIPSYDSLVVSVGTNMQMTEAKAKLEGGNAASKTKIVAEDMDELLEAFIRSFFEILLNKNDQSSLEIFFCHLWSIDVIDKCRKKTCIRLFESVEKSLKEYKNQDVIRGCILVTDAMLTTVAESINYSFVYGSVRPMQKNALLRALATILAYSKPKEMRNSPNSILAVLALYPVRLLEINQAYAKTDNDISISLVDDDPALLTLQFWLNNYSDIETIGASVAMAFVEGFLQSSSATHSGCSWDPVTASTAWERNMAKAVSLLCILPYNYTTNDDKRNAPNELLWPAVFKGLSHAPAAMMGSLWSKADRVSRALLLLEIGCQLKVLSGLGNGTMIIDKATQNMLPPPPNMETMLGDSISFVLHHIASLMATKNDEPTQIGMSSFTTDARLVSSSFARLIAQLETLSKGFPSSIAITTTVDEVSRKSLEFLNHSTSSSSDNVIQHVTLLYAAMASGNHIDADTALSASLNILKMELGDLPQHLMIGQAARSVFQYAKWGAISYLLPKVLIGSLGENKAAELLDKIFDDVADAVQSVPANAILPLFNCIVVALQNRLSAGSFHNGRLLLPDSTKYLKTIIAALFELVDDAENANDATLMIDEICSLIFQPSLLFDEFLRIENDRDCDTPIRDAFRRFMKMAGTQRPHISRIVLNRLCTNFLRPLDCPQFKIGLSAIPYRDDMARLLLHKEDKIESMSLSPASQCEPLGTHVDDTSVSRGFFLVFIHELPDAGKISPSVLTELLHYLIQRNLEKALPSGKKAIMHGTSEYVFKIRSLQALCVLSRFVTASIAEVTCRQLFKALEKEIAHNQIRYFAEIMTLQCARRHPIIFGKALVDHITRTDNSLPMISSLMIISGNLIVGRYKDDFLPIVLQDSTEPYFTLQSILSGTIPWLSSTQSFSRAIAQLLAFQLIPMVIDVDKKSTSEADNDWCLRSIYNFLKENQQMKRLRAKQSKFFDEYEVDSVCTPEGVFSIPVDEGLESNPTHLIELIKECLIETFEEANPEEQPVWKQIVNATAFSNKAASKASIETGECAGQVNFQRKIIPVDALNLALEEAKERKRRNAAGRHKQNLIVCASLIDKAQNLGGLARTSEIFAADRLVIPNLEIAKMDNFRNLSASAGDLIQIEECKEKDLLEWLRQRRGEGYHVIGLEQTSSSISLDRYTFPNRPTVLLLGKEKEGIPIEFLQAVDQCLEIPQLGMIRSLNVHVSGAITIWEFTKQQQFTTHRTLN